MSFDPSDPTQRRFYDYGRAPFPDPRDAELDSFLQGLRPAGGVQAVFELRAVISGAGQSVLRAYASRTAVRAVRGRTPELLVLATVALTIGGLDINDPDALTLMPQIEDASRRLGVHITEVVGPAMDLVGPPGAVYLAQWLAREPENRTLACMGYEAISDDNGVRYVDVRSAVGDKLRLIPAFCSWLESHDWTVESGATFVDVVATRNGERLYAQAIGRSTSPGIDVERLFGQLLRQMPEHEPASVRFAAVLPNGAVPAAIQVPRRIRDLLRITVFVVDAHDNVTELER